MSSSKDRNLALDIARAIGIFPVVYVHVWRGLVKDGIYPADHVLGLIDPIFAIYTMPLFFILAGYNTPSGLARSSQKEFIMRRVRMIVPIYFIWTLVQAFLKMAFANGGGDPVTWADVFAIVYKPIGQFWFLYALLLCHILIALLYKHQKLLLPTVLLALFIGPFMDPVYLSGFPRETVYSWMFYVIGFWVAAHAKSLPRLSEKQMMGLIMGCVLLYLAGTVYAITRDLDLREPYFLPTTLAGIFLALTVSQALAKSRSAPALVMVGQASLSIYVLHVIFIATWRTILMKVFSPAPVVYLTTCTAAGLFGPLLAYVVLKRFNLLRYAYLG